jgi:hypothetical protein
MVSEVAQEQVLRLSEFFSSAYHSTIVPYAFVTAPEMRNSPDEAGFCHITVRYVGNFIS